MPNFFFSQCFPCPKIAFIAILGEKKALPDAGTARAVAAAGTDWGHHRAAAVAVAAGHPGSGADRAGTVADATDRRGPGWPRAMATTSLVRTAMKN